jgi:hypothetical protein
VNSLESPADAISRAVRFCFATLVVGLSYPTINLALRLPAFPQIFEDMLGGKPLPVVTHLAVQLQPFLLALSFLLPVLAVAAIFAPRLKGSTVISGALVLLALGEMFFIWHAVSDAGLLVLRAMMASSW